MQTCALCQCSDDRACEPPCFWVFRDLCSACVFQAVSRAALNLSIDARAEIALQLVELADAISPDDPVHGHAGDVPRGPRIWRPGEP